MENENDSFTFFNEDITDADRAENAQFNLLDSMDCIELWPPGEPCQICYRREGYKYEDGVCLITICDDCFPALARPVNAIVN